ncbi:MAG: glycoside hydrolase domain-containing protein [Nostoc sp.]
MLKTSIVLVFLNIWLWQVPSASDSLATSPVIYMAPSLKRIGQTDKIGSSPSINISAAKGEYESLQLVIKAPASGLTNVNISVSDLFGDKGQIIGKNNITLYREHYVYVGHSSPNPKGNLNPPLGVGWYADGLIPFVFPVTQKPTLSRELKAVPFSLKQGYNQPIWVDVFVPRNVKEGEYTSKFVVTSDQGKTEGKVVLKVWNFQLPLKPSLKSSFAFWDNQTYIANSELLKHKLMPKDVNPKDREALMNLGLTSADLGYWSGANTNTCKMTAPPSKEELKKTAAFYKSSLFLYNYTADEIDDCPALTQQIKRWARNLHEAGVPNLVTMMPNARLYDDGSLSERSAVDIWVLLPSMYEQASDQVMKVLKKGDKVWSYNALPQEEYSPKWEIDFEPINYRIQPGFISQSLGLTGLLYWRVDLWTKDPWHDVQTYQEDGEYYPGEGMLVYPGVQVGIEGVVPSMRLKWLRDGVEDYEYIEILKKLGRGNWALNIGRTVGKNWRNWTRDTNMLTAVRSQLGAEIDRLSPLSTGK